ncbi:MAG: HAMP domain-containing histidine kinase [Treponema sp.]|jgi:signal transduction histidine kinase|nr:HAMP domain-containing histidine kinase [Treponema sp.]
MTISLKNRLTLTYALFISLALGLLTLTINIFTGLIFNALIRENIAARSREIVRDVGDRYNPLLGFDAFSIETIGMHFVHEGYIVTVEDEDGGLVWDARACDMQQCVDVISGIAGRMEEQFGVNGALQKERYPVRHSGRTVGTVTVETYGPFFYSETETRFLTSINRLLLAAGIVLTLVSVCVSTALSRAIARPVKKAGEAARQIAKVHSGGMNPDRLVIRIPDQYKTRELAELSRSLNELAAELEEAENRQMRLTSDIAHELRTPLTCLRGNLEAMLDGVYKPDQKHLESCHEEIMRLAGLVQDLNTLTSLEQETGDSRGMPKQLNKTEFDLARLLRVTAEQFKAAANEKGIEIKLKLRESPVSADYDRLKQVFINILSNAVKYTDRGSITISIEEAGGGSLPPAPAPHSGRSVLAFGAASGASTSPSVWSSAPPSAGGGPPATPPHTRRQVTIADTGIGIPENDLPHIFERLYRSDKSRGRRTERFGTGGAGIGLTIAAAIVHAHGGTISAESPPDGASTGTVFRVVLQGIKPVI